MLGHARPGPPPSAQPRAVLAPRPPGVASGGHWGGFLCLQEPYPHFTDDELRHREGKNLPRGPSASPRLKSKLLVHLPSSYSAPGAGGGDDNEPVSFPRYKGPAILACGCSPGGASVCPQGALKTLLRHHGSGRRHGSDRPLPGRCGPHASPWAWGHFLPKPRHTPAPAPGCSVISDVAGPACVVERYLNPNLFKSKPK